MPASPFSPRFVEYYKRAPWKICDFCEILPIWVLISRSPGSLVKSALSLVTKNKKKPTPKSRLKQNCGKSLKTNLTALLFDERLLRFR